jgi:hypothetical protein
VAGVDHLLVDLHERGRVHLAQLVLRGDRRARQVGCYLERLAEAQLRVGGDLEAGGLRDRLRERNRPLGTAERRDLVHDTSGRHSRP